MSKFYFTGNYRVQSRNDYIFSKLEGFWFKSSINLLNNNTINNNLINNHLWNGRHKVNIIPAIVEKRMGKFETEPDILYKKEFFIADIDSQVMKSNIIDIIKSKEKWIQRISFIKKILHDPEVINIVPEKKLELIIANELISHEAGHFVGYDINSKLENNHFKINNKKIWQLIYLEDFRADLNALQFCLDLLPSDLCIKIFIYNILLRFGVHREGIVNSYIAPYGLVPFFLFCILQEYNFISIIKYHENYLLRFNNLSNQFVLSTIKECITHVNTQINLVEIENDNPIDRAIKLALYINKNLNKSSFVNSFSNLMNQNLTRPIT